MSKNRSFVAYALVLFVVAVAVLVTACGTSSEDAASQPKTPPPTADEAEEAIRDLARRWDEAQQAGDVEAVVSLYAEEGAKASPPDAPTLSGIDAIRAGFAELFDGSGNDVTDTVDEVVASGVVAAARGSYVWNKTDEDGEPFTEVGKWISLHHRRDDGTFVVVHNIWNQDAMPAGAPPLPPMTEEGPAPADGVCADSPTALDASFEAELEAGNVAALVAMHTKNGERLPPGMEAVGGREDLSNYLASRLAPFTERAIDLTGVEEGTAGDLGWTTGQYSFEYTGEGDPVTGAGTYMAVSRKGDDGCWRYKWVLWNRDAPLGG